eukprot:1123236-Rhodomonas_salina.1
MRGSGMEGLSLGTAGTAAENPGSGGYEMGDQTGTKQIPRVPSRGLTTGSRGFPSQTSADSAMLTGLQYSEQAEVGGKEALCLVREFWLSGSPYAQSVPSNAYHHTRGQYRVLHTTTL